LHKNPKPGVEEVKKALAGNICRCTGYRQIIEAVMEAARELNQESDEANSE
jgi:carbon-monoxide dehydrogenase small subunit